MTDLTPAEVRSLAAVIGLTITDDDLEDVTARLNASLEHLRGLDALEPPSGLPSAD